MSRIGNEIWIPAKDYREGDCVGAYIHVTRQGGVSGEDDRDRIKGRKTLFTRRRYLTPLQGFLLNQKLTKKRNRKKEYIKFRS